MANRIPTLAEWNQRYAPGTRLTQAEIDEIARSAPQGWESILAGGDYEPAAWDGGSSSRTPNQVAWYNPTDPNQRNAYGILYAPVWDQPEGLTSDVVGGGVQYSFNGRPVTPVPGDGYNGIKGYAYTDASNTGGAWDGASGTPQPLAFEYGAPNEYVVESPEIYDWREEYASGKKGGFGAFLKKALLAAGAAYGLNGALAGLAGGASTGTGLGLLGAEEAALYGAGSAFDMGLTGAAGLESLGGAGLESLGGSMDFTDILDVVTGAGSDIDPTLLNLLDSPAGGGGTVSDWLTQAATSGNYSLSDLTRIVTDLGVSPSDAARVVKSIASKSGVNPGGILGALAGLSGFGDAEQAGTITQTQAPWEPMQPYLLGAAQSLQDNFTTTPSPEMTTMYNQYWQNTQGLNDLSQQAASGYFDPYLEQVNNVARPGDPNPYLDGVSDALYRDSNRNLFENVMPGIRSGAVANGYGGSRQGIAEGLATSRANEDVIDAMAQQRVGAYENWQNRLLNADEFNANLGLGRNTQNLSATQMALNNRLAPQMTANTALTNGWNMANTMNNYGFNQSANYANAMRGIAGMGGTSSQPYFDNPMGNMMGMAQVGNSIWNGFGGTR